MCLFAGQFKICIEESNWFLGEGDCICPFIYPFEWYTIKPEVSMVGYGYTF